ncbi:class I SAM-dependent methyltransferase [Streptomyces cinnamoneus]|uniref:SAM-dependent methyltransferase n=1 Tax=Streptomyces cinnamoneus TaxID=53446 RepID=UPI00342B436D
MLEQVDCAATVPVVHGTKRDSYQSRVEQVYNDSPELWKKAIGEELWFQFGVYGNQKGRLSTLDEAGRSHLERQLELAQRLSGDYPEIQRVLEIGFGWGTGLMHLARLFPHCPRLDGINISRTQTEYALQRIAEASLSERVHLYLGNALNIDQLPRPEEPYDLVLMRGVVTHFSPATTEAVFAALPKRMRPGAVLIISENLYNVPLQDYTPAIPDETDRLACGYRKTPEYLTGVLADSGFTIRDVRKLPSNQEAVCWLTEIKANIEHCFGSRAPRPLQELRDHADNWSAALRRDRVSVYSVIARSGAV